MPQYWLTLELNLDRSIILRGPASDSSRKGFFRPSTTRQRHLSLIECVSMKTAAHKPTATMKRTVETHWHTNEKQQQQAKVLHSYRLSSITISVPFAMINQPTKATESIKMDTHFKHLFNLIKPDTNKQIDVDKEDFPVNNPKQSSISTFDGAASSNYREV